MTHTLETGQIARVSVCRFAVACYASSILDPAGAAGSSGAD
jgi:hypothetical protein